LILSIMVLQLMSKHRHFESKDSQLLESLERNLGFDASIGVLPHSKPASRYPIALVQEHLPERKLGKLGHRLVLLSSYRVWMAGQSAFAIIATLIIVMVLLGQTKTLGIHG
jgi:hypothetical protein